MAIVLAAWHMPWRASGVTAAASKSREWMGVPFGAICTIGWMAGMTWLTLPMSDDPRRAGAGASTAPTLVMFALKSASSVSLRFSGSYGASMSTTVIVQPVALAAPSAHATTRRYSSHM